MAPRAKKSETSAPVGDPGKVLDLFHPVTAEWFRAVFDHPTAPQREGWPAIARGENTLIFAPTGTGKTLTAFLWCLDRLMLHPPKNAEEACRVIYISPLKALAVDVERNLRSPLAGIANMARRQGVAVHQPGDQRPHRRYLPKRPRPLQAPPRRNPHHHAGVALPAAYLRSRIQPALRRHRHHR